MHDDLCMTYIGALSRLDAEDPYQAFERLRSQVSRIAGLSVLIAAGDARTLPGGLPGELADLLADLALEASSQANDLAGELADWMNRLERQPA